MSGSDREFGRVAGDLSSRVGDRLREADATVAVAESATGGLVGAELTAVPGASDYFLGGVAAYAYDTKRRQLGVDREVLDEHGAVSAPVARAMARGARDVLDATLGLSTTGVAGPTGGTEATPVGTVFVGVAYAGPWGSESSFARATRYDLEGDRAAVRDETVERALSDLLTAVEELESDPES